MLFVSWWIISWYKHNNSQYFCLFRLRKIRKLFYLQPLVPPPHIVYIMTQLIQVFMQIISRVTNLSKLKLWHKVSINIIF